MSHSPSMQELQAAIDLVPVAVLVSNVRTRQVVAANTAALQTFAMTRQRLLDTTVDQLTHPEYRAELTANYARSLTDGGFETLKRYLRGDGTDFMGQLRAQETVGHPDLITAVVSDMEAADALRSEIIAAATVDELTNALRRGAFLDAARLFASVHSHYGLLYIDVDGMKQVNDSIGHSAGDAVLVAVTERIRASFRHGDLLGRFGGDEFVIFVSDLVDPSKVVRLTRALRHRICQPIAHEDVTVDVAVSIGATFCARDVALEAAIEAADQAMLAEKARRRARAGEHREITEDDVVLLGMPSE